MRRARVPAELHAYATGGHPFGVRKVDHPCSSWPERCVEWNGETLAFGEGADRREKPPPDAGEELWLTYYEHIFNPARLKVAMMRREMPRRYWHNLPEAALIQPLSQARKQGERPLQIRLKIFWIRKCCAHLQVFQHAHAQEDTPAFRRLCNL